MILSLRATRLVAMRDFIVLSVLMMIGSACAPGDSASTRGGSAAAEAVPSSLVSTSTSIASTSSPSTPQLDPVAAMSAEATPEFEWTTTPVDGSSRGELASTWRPECPVALEDLRLVELSHWNYEGESVTGRLVVRHDHVGAVVEIFGRLHGLRFPIERMQLIDEYAGDDQASMADNNSSGFNCREIAGSPGVWSQHARGGAVDVNPLVNPWVQASRVDPPEGGIYADRDQDVPGLIRAGDAVIDAFAEAGWGWGGDWSSSKDYQHFSWNGL